VSLKSSIQSVTLPILDECPTLNCPKTSDTNTAEWIDYKCSDTGIDTTKSDRVILYIHGGAFFAMSRKTHRMATWRLAKYSKCRVFSTDYRLAPKDAHPSGLVDVISAYYYLLNPIHPWERRYNPEQISFCGDSAGGSLATALMLYLRDTGFLPLPGAVGVMSPYFDLTSSLPAWHLNKPSDFLPFGTADARHTNDSRGHPYINHDSELTDVYASPIFASEDPEKPIPPMLIQIGDAERPRDDSIFFKTKRFPNSDIQLEIYEDGVHFFQQFCPFDHMARFALKRMGHFLAQHTSFTDSFDIKRDLIRRTPFWIANDSVHSVHRIPDAGNVIDDGINTLVEMGIWKRIGDRCIKDYPGDTPPF
jgi:acetyl esterase/lipase